MREHPARVAAAEMPYPSFAWCELETPALPYRDQRVWLSSRLLIEVRVFSSVTVITPSGVVGRYEWRALSAMIRDVGAERTCVLDLVKTLQVQDAVLLAVLTANRQGRYRRVPFLLYNLPVLTGMRAHLRQVVRRRRRLTT